MFACKFRIVVFISRHSLPDDCMDINHHTKNVRDSIVTNNKTEQMIQGVYHKVSDAFPEHGKPTNITWETTSSSKIQFTVEWR